MLEAHMLMDDYSELVDGSQTYQELDESTYKLEVFFEMGCGNLYLTESVLSETEGNVLYIGIDMKENLIEKKKKIFLQKEKENIYVLSKVVNAKNFSQFYQEKIIPILKAQNKLNYAKVANRLNLNYY